jgi:hypothetical protein
VPLVWFPSTSGLPDRPDADAEAAGQAAGRRPRGCGGAPLAPARTDRLAWPRRQWPGRCRGWPSPGPPSDGGIGGDSPPPVQPGDQAKQHPPDPEPQIPDQHVPPQRRAVQRPDTSTAPASISAPPTTYSPPYSTRTALPAQAATSSNRRGASRPHGRTRASASSAPATFSAPAAAASQRTAESRSLASSSNLPRGVDPGRAAKGPVEADRRIQHRHRAGRIRSQRQRPPGGWCGPGGAARLSSLAHVHRPRLLPSGMAASSGPTRSQQPPGERRRRPTMPVVVE